jgi:MSHA biogenesis protein MshM
MIKKYISFRLFHAGYNGSKLFSDLAVNAISKFSRGVPRSINVLCHKALLIAYSKEKDCVSLFDVWQAYRSDKPISPMTYLFTAVLGVSLGGLFFMLLGT